LNVYDHIRSDNHPSTSFLYLLITVFVSAIIFSLIGLAIGAAIYGTTVLQLAANGFENLQDKELNFLSIAQIFSAIGTFVVPALLLNRLERNHQPYFNLNFNSNWKLYLIVILLMMVYTPFFEWTIILNEQLKLPDFMSGITEWMRAKEDETATLTNALLSRTSIGAFFTNLFMVGFLAAIGEELLFRGCVQQILIKWFNKPHLAIWLTAIIFSAIHLQFYGFLPRMLIGALCGYLYFFGKSIWLAILAHFVNNAAAIILAFYLTTNGKPLDYFEYNAQGWPLALLSFVFGTALLYFYRKLTFSTNNSLS